ncbi:hypothetical protein TIN2_42 [Tsukamurella phage TIN2]|uniref:Uncharacterized protein n=1 Tax=Tsukamurella phage TIN2 TaxID=1636545 RepID=A0A0K0N5P8_9CAUD|nr:hypothetical protein AVT55_gp081 [Tsukamurella phage TIN2]AKJ71732.1 hypothetical protein TIN2_42 [Tsukamurella phage TIN2]
MRLYFEVEILDAEVNLDNYKTDDCPSGVATIQDAVNLDLDMYRAGEASLEEVIFNLAGETGEVKISLSKIIHNEVITIPNNENN